MIIEMNELSIDGSMATRIRTLLFSLDFAAMFDIFNLWVPPLENRCSTFKRIKNSF